MAPPQESSAVLQQLQTSGCICPQIGCSYLARTTPKALQYPLWSTTHPNHFTIYPSLAPLQPFYPKEVSRDKVERTAEDTTMNAWPQHLNLILAFAFKSYFQNITVLQCTMFGHYGQTMEYIQEWMPRFKTTLYGQPDSCLQPYEIWYLSKRKIENSLSPRQKPSPLLLPKAADKHTAQKCQQFLPWSSTLSFTL